MNKTKLCSVHFGIHASGADPSRIESFLDIVFVAAVVVRSVLGGLEQSLPAASPQGEYRKILGIKRSS